MSIHQSALRLLDQLEETIAQLGPNNFSQAIPTLSNATIGQHVRHTLEFFLCLIASSKTSEVNYDNRLHDKTMENDLQLALRTIHDIRAFLKNQREDFPLLLEANYAIDEDELIQIPSSYHRELAYNIEHAIHHMALIKVGVKIAFPHVELPVHFGVASSTVRFQQQQA
ncbi:DinB family protein [Marinoscillum furvescens]|uniref:DinB family protein n=1 Tax=Marinoscillum furvescens DSM 4134 TaxID=1122208 RepID=A0A3D9L4H7_MARFU|nr:DinB family protein [Marinoscillum furvescens]RED98847.1 hypothetical protein C7460_10939 [Marinoscillum furvescens DSM 4134]